MLACKWPPTALYNTLKTKPISRLIPILLFAHHFCSPEITLSRATTVSSLLWASGPSRDSIFEFCTFLPVAKVPLQFLCSQNILVLEAKCSIHPFSVKVSVVAAVTVRDAGQGYCDWGRLDSPGTTTQGDAGLSIWVPCLQSTFLLSRKQRVSPILSNSCSRSLWMLCDCKGPFRPTPVMWQPGKPPGLPVRGELGLYNGSDCSSLENVQITGNKAAYLS